MLTDTAMGLDIKVHEVTHIIKVIDDRVDAPLPASTVTALPAMLSICQY